MEVYMPDYSAILTIPHRDVYHVPASNNAAPTNNSQLPNGQQRLVLCPHFNPNVGPHSCPHSNSEGSETCPHVHALVLNAQRRPIHVNYAWRDASLCCYSRGTSDPDVTLKVALPNERHPTDFISLSLVLQTRALLQVARRPVLTHCAHYYYTRVCNLGSQCTFVHAVYVDPTAADGQFAPPPAVIPGRPSPGESRRRRWLTKSSKRDGQSSEDAFSSSVCTSSSSGEDDVNTPLRVAPLLMAPPTRVAVPQQAVPRHSQQQQLALVNPYN